MKRHIFIMLACLTLRVVTPASARDVTITNARIIVANGTVIEHGSIVVRGGKIVSVGQMQAQLEAGYTTILSGGGPADGNITLRDHIEKGGINGPRIIPSGSLRLNNNSPETARAEIRKMAEIGIKFTGEIALTPVPGPSEKVVVDKR